MTALHQVKSGIPGMFYRRPAPGKPLFAEEGSRVEVGDTVGLVEIMKSFHPVVADAAGTVVRFLVDDNGEVAPGQDVVEIDTQST